MEPLLVVEIEEWAEMVEAVTVVAELLLGTSARRGGARLSPAVHRIGSSTSSTSSRARHGMAEHGTRRGSASHRHQNTSGAPSSSTWCAASDLFRTFVLSARHISNG